MPLVCCASFVISAREAVKVYVITGVRLSACLEHRIYQKFNDQLEENYVEGSRKSD